MDWWQWLEIVAAVVVLVILASSLPSFVRYWKMRRM